MYRKEEGKRRLSKGLLARPGCRPAWRVAAAAGRGRQARIGIGQALACRGFPRGPRSRAGAPKVTSVCVAGNSLRIRIRRPRRPPPLSCSSLSYSRPLDLTPCCCPRPNPGTLSLPARPCSDGRGAASPGPFFDRAGQEEAAPQQADAELRGVRRAQDQGERRRGPAALIPDESVCCATAKLTRRHVVRPRAPAVPRLCQTTVAMQVLRRCEPDRVG